MELLIICKGNTNTLGEEERKCETVMSSGDVIYDRGLIIRTFMCPECGNQLEIQIK